MTPAERKARQRRAQEQERIRKGKRQALAEATLQQKRPQEKALQEKALQEEGEEEGESTAEVAPKYGGFYAVEHWWNVFPRARLGKYKAVMLALDAGMPIEAKEPETGDTLLMAGVVRKRRPCSDAASSECKG